MCERSETCAKSILCEMTGYGFFIYWGTEGGEGRGGEGSGSGGLGKSKDSSKHFALITKFVSYFDSQLLIIY